MKTIVIGNGYSTRDFELGNKIDSAFDNVVRFNRGFFEGVNGYEKYIGSKTNTLIIHDGFAVPERLTDNVLNSVNQVLVVTPNFKFNQNNFDYANKQHGWGDKVQPISGAHELNLRKIANFGSRWPTTGLIGLYYICMNYEDVTLYGFDNSDEKYKYYHYFAKTNGRTTKYMNRDNRVDHIKEAEDICFKTIKDTFKVKEFYE